MNKTLLALALLGATSIASADSWIYGGLSVGKSDLDGLDDTAYSLHVGTGILPFIGIEGGYTHHGKFSDHGNDVSVKSFYGAIKPSINFGELQIYAKGGLHSWSLDADAGAKFKDDDGYDLMWSVGADYEVFGPFALGANYSNYVIDGDHVGSYNLTAALHFL